MKTIKITLILIAIASIGAGVIFWFQNIEGPDEIKKGDNQFVKKIEKEIEKLKFEPDNKFSKETYKNVLYKINEYDGKFGDNQSGNDQTKEYLEKTLYATYAEKFVKQAFYVFKHHDWKPSDLRFIRKEKKKLKKSKFLVKNSPVYIDLNKIDEILNKYYDVRSFIASCNNFSYPDYSSLSSTFPLSDVKEKILRARELGQNHLENKYVNNCKRLHNQLKEVSNVLFIKNVNYLDKKIDYWSNQWCLYASQADYQSNLGKPIREEIDKFGYSDIYKEQNVNKEYKRLSKKWDEDNMKAYEATYPCDDNN